MSSFVRTLRWYSLVVPMALRNWAAVQQGTRGSRIFFAEEITRLLGCDQAWLAQTAREFRACMPMWRRLSALRSRSRRTDGFAKTLDPAEAFALWALVKHEKPRVVVELGSQRGLSARVWKEALRRYVPDHELILCDLEDRRAFINPDEATFLLGDARETLRDVFATRQIDLLYNDAHPYDLITWSLEEGIRQNIRLFAFHDVGHKHPRGIYRRSSASLPPDEKLRQATNYAGYGTWERHVMAEMFDPRILDVDFVQNDRFTIQVFDSLFGFAAVINRSAVPGVG